MIINKDNIDKYINYNVLSCISRGITSIEDIPDHITSVYCQYNLLTQLPKLPSGLRWLVCTFNKLTCLPKLPDGLFGLYCNDNQLTSLPMLPDSLMELYCQNNQLTSYPHNSEDDQWWLDHNNHIKLTNRLTIIENLINENK